MNSKEYYCGVLLWEVRHIIKEKKIPLIECHSIKAAENIYKNQECNYIYIMPESVT